MEKDHIGAVSITESEIVYAVYNWLALFQRVRGSRTR